MNAEEHPAGKDPAIGRDSLMAPQYPPCMVIALLAPLFHELPLRVRLPSGMLEVSCGSLVGPQVVGWVRADGRETRDLGLRWPRDAARLRGSIRHVSDAMKTTKQFTLIALFAASLALPAFAQKAVNTPSGKLEFKNG